MTRSGTIVLAGLMMLAAPICAAGVPFPGSHDSDCRKFEIAAGNAPMLRVVNGNGVFEITKRGRKITATHDGRELAF